MIYKHKQKKKRLHATVSHCICTAIQAAVFGVCSFFGVCVSSELSTHIASYDKYTLHEKCVSHSNLKTHKQFIMDGHIFSSHACTRTQGGCQFKHILSLPATSHNEFILQSDPCHTISPSFLLSTYLSIYLFIYLAKRTFI